MSKTKESKDPLVQTAASAAGGFEAVLEAFKARTAEMEIDNDVMELRAKKGIAWAKDQKKQLEEKRKSITGPASKAVRAANAVFKPQSDLCDEIIKLLTSKLSHRRRVKEAEQKKLQAELDARAEAARREKQEEMRKTAEALEEQGSKAQAEDLRRTAESLPKADVVTMEPAKNKVAGLVEREVWECVIVDADAIPNEWCDRQPRVQSMLAECRRTNGSIKIPGVEFRKATQFAR